MQFTDVGYILFFLGVFSLLFNSNLLYIITIFFLPFSATAVINIGEKNDGHGIQPYIFFGSLWMCSFVLKTILRTKKSNLHKVEWVAIMCLAGFALTAMMSLCMPKMINGAEIGNMTGGLNDYYYINFSSTNTTQYLYLLHGILFAICIFFHNRNIRNYKKTIKIYYWSTLFVLLWGVQEFFFETIMETPPLQTFNNSYHSAASGFLATVDTELQRIASVTLEASIFSQVVILICPFIVWGIIEKDYLVNKQFDVFYLVVLIFVMMMSVSATGILCLIVLSVLCSYQYLQSLHTTLKPLLAVALAFFMISLFSISYFSNKNIIDMMLFEKIGSYSWQMRFGSVQQAWVNFEHYPILGVGWGSVTSTDLAVKLLSNTGLVGFLFFAFFLIRIFLNLRKSGNKRISRPIITVFYLLLFMNELSGFSFYLGHSWLFLGLSMVVNGKEAPNQIIT